MPQVPEGKLGVLMVNRDTEFAPVKNKDAFSENNEPLPDTPSYARMMFLKESQSWLQKVQGLKIDEQALGNVEVSPLLSYAGENLNWLANLQKGASYEAPGGFIDHTGSYTVLESSNIAKL